MFKLDTDTIEKLDFKDPAIWAATWFGTGFMQPAPGTWGSIAALPFGVLIMVVGGPITLFIATVLVTALGYWASDKVEKMTGAHDLSFIVIDEAAGLWLTLLICNMTPLSILCALLLFRVFDMLKPWPISLIDKKTPGALGVMLDDLAAGIAAAAILGGMQYAGFV